MHVTILCELRQLDVRMQASENVYIFSKRNNVFAKNEAYFQYSAYFKFLLPHLFILIILKINNAMRRKQNVVRKYIYTSIFHLSIFLIWVQTVIGVSVGLSV